MKVGVYGNLTIDELERERSSSIRPGGSAFYSSLAAAFFGVQVRAISNVGHDFPKDTLNWMETRGIDTRGVTESDEPTTRFGISYRIDSRRLLLISHGRRVNPPISSAMSQGIHLGPVFREIGEDTLAYARRHCKFLSLDVQGLVRDAGKGGVIRLVKRRLDAFVSKSDLVKATDKEICILTSIGNVIRAGRKLLKNGPDFALVTQGGRGSYLMARDEGDFRLPAFPEQRVIDPTGAGDVLVGSWLATYLDTRDALWSGAVGSAFSSLAVRASGRSKFRFPREELLRRAAWVYENSRKVKG